MMNALFKIIFKGIKKKLDMLAFWQTSTSQLLANAHTFCKTFGKRSNFYFKQLKCHIVMTYCDFSCSSPLISVTLEYVYVFHNRNVGVNVCNRGHVIFLV